MFFFGTGFFKEKEPIVVYQMGKVGSRTIIDSLEALGMDGPIFHIHYLIDESKISASHKSSFRLRDVLFKNCKECVHQKKWKLISLTREPIARNISAFFQNIDLWMPSFKCEPSKTNELIKIFLEKYPHTVPLEWFDKEMNAAFDIDVFAHHFPQNKGYQIYYGEKADLLVIKLEELNFCAEEAFKKFFGLDSFKLANANIARKKEYYETYRNFTKLVKFDHEYLNMMYNSKYMKHFYSEEEVESFMKKWEKKL
jgi:hypothetical protein